MELIRVLTSADKVVVISEGKGFGLSGETAAAFMDIFESVTADGYEMPALGVSLDALVKKDMESGVWLKFCFGGTRVHREMPFDELAVRLMPEYCGLEFMRGNGGVYEGRDYYYCLKKGQTAAKLYDFVSAAVR